MAKFTWGIHNYLKILLTVFAIASANTFIHAQNVVEFNMKDGFWNDVNYQVSYNEEEGEWKWTSQQLDGFSFYDCGFFIRKDRISFAIDEIDNPTQLPVDPKDIQKKYFIIDRDGIKFNDPDNHKHIDFIPVDADKFLDAYYKLWFMLTKGQVVPPPRGENLW